MVGERLSSREKGQKGREEVLRPGFEILGEEGEHRYSDSVRNRDSIGNRDSSQDRVHRLLSRLNLDRTQAAIILCGFYLFFSLAGEYNRTSSLIPSSPPGKIQFHLMS
jgi:hypothetical protein